MMDQKEFKGRTTYKNSFKHDSLKSRNTDLHLFIFFIFLIVDYYLWMDKYKNNSLMTPRYYILETILFSTKRFDKKRWY